MEQTQEYQNDQCTAQYGDCFLRGNNGKFIEMKNIFHVFIMFSFVHFSSHQLERLFHHFVF